MFAIGPYTKLRYKESFHYPYLGKGVYLFLLCTAKGDYVTWYVGQSNDIGKRWYEHVKSYLDPPSEYWIPKDIDKFINDPVHEINIGEFAPEDRNFDKNKRIIASEKLLNNSYFCYAEIIKKDQTQTDREHVESVLLYGIKKKLGIINDGYIGDRSCQRKIPDGLIVENVFEKQEIQDTLGRHLPLQLP